MVGRNQVLYLITSRRDRKDIIQMQAILEEILILINLIFIRILIINQVIKLELLQKIVRKQKYHSDY